MGKKRRQRPNDSGERPASVEKGKATWKRLKIPPLLAEGGADDGASVYSVEKLEGVRLGFEKGPDGKSKLAGIYMDDETVDFKTLAKICNNEDAENEDLPSDFGEYVNVDEFDESGVSSNGRGFMKVGNKMEVDRGAISRIQSPSWADLGLRDDLIAALKKLKFDRPTEIQESMIPVALNGAHDVFGAAETGSGKTLAFGIPIIQKALDNRDRRGAPGDGAESPGMTALIIEPTRELAAQVTKALEQLSGPLKVKFARIIGGMSEDKQQRVISGEPEVVVATVGRLWSLLEKDQSFLHRIRDIHFLVIDEADRMTEKGHFAELDKFFTALSSEHERGSSNVNYSTLVVSATLNVAIGKNFGAKSGKNTPPGALARVLRKLRTKDKRPVYINLLKDSVIPEKINETIVKCLHDEKDNYLYYILLKHPGRVIVFVNFIKKVKELRTILNLLGFRNVKQLHSDMEQSKRFNSVELFESCDKSILIATDIAARGLDITNVEHIIHYDTPRSRDVYVHRCGRTARIGASGVSILLCSPAEYHLLETKSLIPSKNLEDLNEFNVNMASMNEIRVRIGLARKIYAITNSSQKIRAGKIWFEKAAKELDIDLDSDFIISKKDKRAFAGNGKNTQSDTYQTKSGEKWRRLELSRLEDALEKSMLVDIKL